MATDGGDGGSCKAPSVAKRRRSIPAAQPTPCESQFDEHQRKSIILKSMKFNNYVHTSTLTRLFHSQVYYGSQAFPQDHHSDRQQEHYTEHPLYHIKIPIQCGSCSIKGGFSEMMKCVRRKRIIIHEKRTDP